MRRSAETRAPDARVTELLDAYLAATLAGSPPDRDAFLAANADVADELRVALVGFDFVRRAGDELSAATAGGNALPAMAGIQILVNFSLPPPVRDFSYSTTESSRLGVRPLSSR